MNPHHVREGRLTTTSTTAPTTGAPDAPREPAGEESAAAARAVRVANAVFWLALVAGALFRLVRYVDNRSLWLDESFLAINLIDRSAGRLLETLDFAQSAPPGFLLAEKGVIDVLGDSEQSLRLLPLVSSLIALGLFAWLARLLLRPWTAVLALVLFALNEFSVVQAAELKQYSTDVAFSVLLLALLVLFVRGPPTLVRVLPLVVAGAIAPFFSFPSVLVLVGVGLAALLALYQEGRTRDLVVTAMLMGSWLVAFGVVFALASNSIESVSAEVFAGEASAGQGLSHNIELSWSLFVNPGNFSDGTNALAVLLAAFGLLEVVKRDRPWLVVALGLPLLAAFAAAVLERYPLGNRYSLFLLPIMILLVTRGAAALVRDSRRALLLGVALAIMLVVPQSVTAIRHAWSAPRPEDVRPLLVTAANGWRPGDTLYVYRNAQYAVRYYGTCDDCRPDGIEWPWPIRRAPSIGTGEQFAPALSSVPPTFVVGTQEPTVDRIAADVARFPHSGRIWLVLSHVWDHGGLDERLLLMRDLESRGRLVGSWRSGTAYLLLYQLGA